MALLRNATLYALPNFVSLILTVALIPITTAHLTPEDIGRIALVTSVTGVIPLFALLGYSFLWAAHYPQLDDSERSAFVSTLAAVGLIAALGLAGIAATGWLLVVAVWPAWPLETPLRVGMALASAVGMSFWFQTQDLLLLEGQAGRMAAVSLAATVCSALTTVVGLVWLGWGASAVYASALFAALIYAAGGLSAVWRQLSMRLSRRWVREIILRGLPTTPANILEALQTVAERYLLTWYVSMNSLGLYVHAQNYRNGFSLITKAATRSLWPVSLAEARAPEPSFPRTQRAWRAILLLITISGLVFAAIGRELVSILTHGRFEVSAPYVTGWFIYVAVQYSGLAQTAVLYAQGRGISISNCQVACRLGGVALLWLGVFALGPWGALLAAVAHALIYRVAIGFMARSAVGGVLNDLPFAFSVGVLVFGLVAQVVLWDNLACRVGLVALGLVFSTFAFRATLIDFAAGYAEKARSWQRPWTQKPRDFSRAA